MKPVALIATFTDAVLPVILDEIAAGGDPPVADWFVGTYGVNAATARRVEATPGCGYAPIFSVQPPNSRRARLGRHVPPPVAAVLDPARAGAIPGSSAGAVVPPSDRRAWGLELGRRFRDDLRAARASGVPVSAWQFDEILGECGRPGAGNPHREFVGGVLRGLAEGRPELGESHEPGFVWAARTAITRLPGLPLVGELQQFWQDLDRATLLLVGEEYPEFRGDPGEVGRRFSDGHGMLLDSAGPIRRSLGERYMVGMTPGWRPLSAGLGGNVDGRQPAFVTSWRNGFIDGRIAARRPRGYAQFNFRVENARPARAKDAVRSLHHACRQHGA
ncbi:MAG: hypothetical protein ACM33B_11430 [Pseudomonadota bacterium]